MKTGCAHAITTRILELVVSGHRARWWVVAESDSLGSRDGPQAVDVLVRAALPG